MTTTQSATVKVFLKAFHGLSKAQRHVFLDELLRERAYREDLLNSSIHYRNPNRGRCSVTSNKELAPIGSVPQASVLQFVA